MALNYQVDQTPLAMALVEEILVLGRHIFGTLDSVDATWRLQNMPVAGQPCHADAQRTIRFQSVGNSIRQRSIAHRLPRTLRRLTSRLGVWMRYAMRQRHVSVTERGNTDE